MDTGKKVIKISVLDAVIAAKITPDKKLAESLIRAGKVLINDSVYDKPGFLVSQDCIVRVRGQRKYVARSGQKLQGALDYWRLNLTGKTILDVGSSTGGFVQVLLEAKAGKVIAVDVGYGLLHPSIRNNPRVVVMERRAVESLRKDEIPFIPDFFTVDVSFTSLSNVLDAVKYLCSPLAGGIVLLKPQFEILKSQKGALEKGVLKDTALREQTIRQTIHRLEKIGFKTKDRTPSTLKGKTGNLEELLLLERTSGNTF